MIDVEIQRHIPRLTSSSALLPARQPANRVTFSQELQSLAQRFLNRPVTLKGIIAETQGRGFDLLLVLIPLPFLTPVPLLGLSTPFGLVVFLIGARLALGRQPWLPQQLPNRELPKGFISRVFSAATRIVKLLEFLLRPRLGFLHEQLVFRRISGALIMLSGMLLLLPVPVPFTNTLPALTVILLAAASMERDGVVFLTGCGLFTLTLAYFGLLCFGGSQLLASLRQSLLGT